MHSKYFVLVFLGITLLILIAGVLLMARGGKLNQKYANKFMVMRVVLQAVTIAIVFLLFFKYSK